MVLFKSLHGTLCCPGFQGLPRGVWWRSMCDTFSLAVWSPTPHSSYVESELKSLRKLVTASRRRQSNGTPTAVQRQSQQTLRRGANGDELKRVAYHFALAVTTG